MKPPLLHIVFPALLLSLLLNVGCKNDTDVNADTPSDNDGGDTSEDSDWITDFDKAKEIAKQENKLILMDFTGSDWCHYCVKFNEEVLSKEEFKTYAKENLVLVKVDFPRNKEQSAALKKANAALQEKYQVNGYPTYVVLNSGGEEIGRQEGYSTGGPKAFTAKIRSYTKK